MVLHRMLLMQKKAIQASSTMAVAMTSDFLLDYIPCKYISAGITVCVCVGVDGCAVDRKIKSWLVLWHWVQSMFAHEHWNVHIARSESYTKCSASYADLHVKIEFQYLPLKCCVKLNRINTKRTTHPSKNDYPPTYHHHHHHHHFFSSNLAKCEWSIFEYFPNGACTFTDHAQREWRAK